MNPHEPLFWLVIITGIIAVSFGDCFGDGGDGRFGRIAGEDRHAAGRKLDPLINRANAISEQAQRIAVQGRQIAEQFT
jgi:hypothetical protein